MRKRYKDKERRTKERKSNVKTSEQINKERVGWTRNRGKACFTLAANIAVVKIVSLYIRLCTFVTLFFF